MVLGALAALLEIEGDISVVARARNGKEALQAVLTHKPDVFITDIEMPEMTGLDVAAELKRRKASTRVIILTTFARAGSATRARSWSFRLSVKRYAGGTISRRRPPGKSGLTRCGS